MEWQQWGARFTEVLALEQAPVAVTYTHTPPPGVTPARHRACGALLQAAAGATIDLTAETSACGGGSEYLGLCRQSPEHARVLHDFLINGEKLFSSLSALQRSRALSVPPPFGLAEHVLFAPLEQAPLLPDVVVFACNPWQAARLVGLCFYQDGAPMACDPTGSLCRSAITYPLITGRVNITFGDTTARRMERIPEDRLFVTLPYPHLASAAASLDRSSAGTAPVEIPPAMRELMRRTGEPPEL